MLVNQVADVDPSTRTILIATGLMLVVVSALVVALAWRTSWSFASLATVLVAGALIVSPAAAPSFALVLLPLAVVAVRAWSHLLVWQACEIGHWAVLGFYLGGVLAPSGGGDARAYWLGVVLRLGGLVWLIGATAMLRCRHRLRVIVDPVERGGGEPDADVDVLADLGHARP